MSSCWYWKGHRLIGFSGRSRIKMFISLIVAYLECICRKVLGLCLMGICRISPKDLLKGKCFYALSLKRPNTRLIFITELLLWTKAWSRLFRTEFSWLIALVAFLSEPLPSWKENYTPTAKIFYWHRHRPVDSIYSRQRCNLTAFYKIKYIKSSSNYNIPIN